MFKNRDICLSFLIGFPGGSDGKESACNARDLGSIPWSWRSPGGENGYPFQYPHLGNPMDREAWHYSSRVHRVRHDWTTFTFHLSWLVCARMYVCSVTQSCLMLCNPVDCSPPGASVHGTSQARILGWVAIPFSRGSSWPRDRTQVPCIAGRFFTIWATREALLN